MRTTLDLPDPLMRELKARAAMDGVKLKDYFAAMVREALQRPPGGATAPTRSPAPVFRRSNPDALPILPVLSKAQLGELLDSEDAGASDSLT
jgi:hypothetical protein